MKRIASTLSASLALALASHAQADTVHSNVPGGATASLPFASFGNGAKPSGDSPQVGEVFALSSDAQLSSFSFYAIGTPSLPGLHLSVAAWNPGSNAQNQAVNNIGAPLLSTSAPALLSFNAASGTTALSFEQLNLVLRAGQKYIAYLSSPDASVTGVQLSRTQTAADASGFGIGLAYFSTIPGNGWQLPFNGNGFLSLQYSAVTTPVPEPSTIALLVAGMVLIGLRVQGRRSQQR